MKSCAEYDYSLALIGHAGAGKTVLAAALSNCANQSVAVSIGDGVRVVKRTVDYLEEAQRALRNGGWPVPTVDTVIDITLRLNRVGRQSAVISFQDYQGSKIASPNFCRNYVRDPDMAAIVVNPELIGNCDDAKRFEMMNDFKRCIDHLGMAGGRCKNIAVVISAADRLETFSEEAGKALEVFKAELAAYLNASRFHRRWREFAVSVGSEADTSWVPFCWLVDEMERFRVKERVRKAAGRVLAVVAAVGVIATGSAWWSWQHERSGLRQAIGECEICCDAVDDALRREDVASVKANLNRLRDVAIKTLAESVCRWEGNRKLRDEATGRFVAREERGRIEWVMAAMNQFGKRIEREIADGRLIKVAADDGGWDGRFTELDRALNLLEAAGQRLDILRRDWSTLRAKLADRVDAHNVRWMETHFTAPAKATKAACDEIRRTIERFAFLSDDVAVNNERRTHLLEVFDLAASGWRRQAFERDSESLFKGAREKKTLLDLMGDGFVFFNNYADNPFAVDIGKRYVQTIEERLEGLVQRLCNTSETRHESSVWREGSINEEGVSAAKAAYSELLEFCSILDRREDKYGSMPGVKTSWLIPFAKKFVTVGGSGIENGFVQTAVVSRVEAKLDYESVTNIPDFYAGVGVSFGFASQGTTNKEAVVEMWRKYKRNEALSTLAATNANTGAYSTLWEGERELVRNPWTSLQLVVSAKQLTSYKWTKWESWVDLSETQQVPFQPESEVVVNKVRFTGKRNQGFTITFKTHLETSGFTPMSLLEAVKAGRK